MAKAKIKQQLAHVPERKEDMSSYSEGQTHQLMDVFEAEQFSAAEITKLGQNRNLLSGIKAVLNGIAKIKPVSEDATRFITINETMIVVNLGATPRPLFDGTEAVEHKGEGWVVVEKRADGLYINGRKVNLYLSKRQKGGKWLKGMEISATSFSGEPFTAIRMAVPLFVTSFSAMVYGIGTATGSAVIGTATPRFCLQVKSFGKI